MRLLPERQASSVPKREAAFTPAFLRHRGLPAAKPLFQVTAASGSTTCRCEEQVGCPATHRAGAGVHVLRELPQSIEY